GPRQTGRPVGRGESGGGAGLRVHRGTRGGGAGAPRQEQRDAQREEQVPQSLSHRHGTSQDLAQGTGQPPRWRPEGDLGTPSETGRTSPVHGPRTEQTQGKRTAGSRARRGMGRP